MLPLCDADRFGARPSIAKPLGGGLGAQALACDQNSANVNLTSFLEDVSPRHQPSGPPF